MSSRQNGKMVQTDQRQNPTEGQREEPKLIGVIFRSSGDTQTVIPLESPKCGMSNA